MDIGSYGYVLLVAALGMAIVFLFLWFLSGLMSLIKRLFDDGPARTRRKTEAQDTPLQSTPVAFRGNNWLVAAATAFLEAELLDQSSDPGPWVRNRPREGPWLSAPRRNGG